tara:strand:+ start:283 stop:417 length:135 start_codon:yes stop_codon:yes gene_type:complete
VVLAVKLESFVTNGQSTLGLCGSGFFYSLPKENAYNDNTWGRFR